MFQEGKDSITLVAVGDIRLARKDYKVSFAKVAHIIKSGDIAFYNNEGVYAERGNHPSFYRAKPYDPKKMSGLTLAGFNVCNMANNQSLNWGINAGVECWERLKAMGIAVCGFGRDMTEARQPAIVQKKGVRVAFLGYLSVGPNQNRAEEDRPGVAMVRVYTSYQSYDTQPGTLPRILTWPYKEDLQNMIEDIKKAREQADIVVVVPHWGIHDTPVVIPDYEWDVGHAAVDAGADLVLGTHPHILKGIEVYKGKVIMHSVANFAMEDKIGKKEGELSDRQEQPWKAENERLRSGGLCYSPDDQKSIIVKCVIAGKKMERVSYIPVLLEDNASPKALPHGDPRSQDVVKYMEDITRAVGLNTKFCWDGDEVVIGL
jgi:poly-gamma-glutamate synthesis protein (capsule biosynthesis protein)